LFLIAGSRVSRRLWNIIVSRGKEIPLNKKVKLRSTAAIGEKVTGQEDQYRADLEYYRVVVSKKTVTGLPLGSLQIPFEFV
jgi:uncharacterized transporter YbjL